MGANIERELNTVLVPAASTVASPSENMSDNDEHSLVIVEHDTDTDEYTTILSRENNGFQKCVKEVVSETVNANTPTPTSPSHLDLKSPAMSDMSGLPPFSDSFQICGAYSPASFCSTPLPPPGNHANHRYTFSPLLMPSPHSLSENVRHVYLLILHTAALSHHNIDNLLHYRPPVFSPQPVYHEHTTVSMSHSIIGPPCLPLFMSKKI